MNLSLSLAAAALGAAALSLAPQDPEPREVAPECAVATPAPAPDSPLLQAIHAVAVSQPSAPQAPIAVRTTAPEVVVAPQVVGIGPGGSSAAPKIYAVQVERQPSAGSGRYVLEVAPGEAIRRYRVDLNPLAEAQDGGDRAETAKRDLERALAQARRAQEQARVAAEAAQGQASAARRQAAQALGRARAQGGAGRGASASDKDRIIEELMERVGKLEAELNAARAPKLGARLDALRSLGYVQAGGQHEGDQHAAEAYEARGGLLGGPEWEVHGGRGLPTLDRLFEARRRENDERDAADAHEAHDAYKVLGERVRDSQDRVRVHLEEARERVNEARERVRDSLLSRDPRQPSARPSPPTAPSRPHLDAREPREPREAPVPREPRAPRMRGFAPGTDLPGLPGGVRTDRPAPPGSGRGGTPRDSADARAELDASLRQLKRQMADLRQQMAELRASLEARQTDLR